MDNVIDMTKKGDRRRLATAQDIRLFLADLIRRVDADKMTESKGKTLTYMAATLMNVVRDHEIEERVSALERGRNAANS